MLLWFLTQGIVIDLVEQIPIKGWLGPSPKVSYALTPGASGVGQQTFYDIQQTNL